jgi:TonB family protein
MLLSNRLPRARNMINCSFAGGIMKPRLLFLSSLLFLTGCSLLWSPTATVKKFMAASQKGDVDTMTQLFSSKAVQKIGLDTIRSNNQSFADTAKRASAVGGNYRMADIHETSTPEGKRVSFYYKNDKGTDSLKLVFDLSKEGSAWKIDNIGGSELEASNNQEIPAVEAPLVAPIPVPQQPNEKSDADKKPESKRAPISGGVLNGKAISLPKPPYPPIAKAAKASGTVVVQVLVDEDGNVIEAHAVSGHPLLQAASVAAARAAKFSPTKLSGQLVKVSGVITYNFVAQ